MGVQEKCKVQEVLTVGQLFNTTFKETFQIRHEGVEFEEPLMLIRGRNIEKPKALLKDSKTKEPRLLIKERKIVKPRTL